VMAFALGSSLFSILPTNQPSHTEQADCAPNGACDKERAPKSLWERVTIIWDRTFDDPVAFYTLVLGIFTALLVAVAGIQIRYLIRTDKTARISAEAAKKSDDALPALE